MAKAFCSRAIHDERDYAAGHPDRAPRLDRETWDGMVANVHAIAQLAAERYGVRAVIHPHAGGYIEFDDELDRVAEDVPGEVVGLCLDTGHLDYSGMDPVEGIVTQRRTCGPSGDPVASGMEKISYAGYRFPPEIIDQAIWLYLRFTLSLRDVEDLLAERGVAVSYETVRRWVNHFRGDVCESFRSEPRDAV